MNQQTDHNEQQVLEFLFSEIFREYEQRLHTLAYRLTKCEQYAKDIVQEVFLKLWEQREQLSSITNMDAWLYRITENRTIDFLRKAATDSRLRGTIWNNLQQSQAQDDFKPVVVAKEHSGRFEYLFQQYIRNNCPRPELKEFFTRVNQNEYKESLRHLVRDLNEDIRKSDPSHTSVNEYGQLVVKKHEWSTRSQTVPPATDKKRMIAIAVGVILIVCVVLLAWYRRQSTIGGF